MNTQKIIVAVVCALVLVLGGYWIFTSEKSGDVKNTQETTLTISGSPTTDTSPIKTEAVKQETETNINKTETNKKIMYATLNTNKGNITLELFTETTPETVANFIKLAESGFYDGTKFHRVMKGFMSQGGDPLSKDDSKMAQWGTGGPGYKFKDEINTNNSNQTNTISMANSGPNTNGSQFFINAQNNDFLNTKHTVFGRVVDGTDIALAINSVATVPGDRPVDPVIIQSITLK